MEQTDQMDLDSILETRQQYMDVLAYLYRGLSAIRRFEGMSRDINTDIVNCSNEIKSQQGRINNANRILAANDRKMAHPKKESNVAANALTGIVIGLMLFLIFIALFVGMMAGTMIVTFVLAFLIIVIGGVIILVIRLGNKGVKSATKAVGSSMVNSSMAAIPDAQKRIADLRARIENDLVKLPEVRSLIDQSRSDISSIVLRFPPAYCDVDVVQRFLFYFENQKVDTIKEAVNAYDNEMFQQQVLYEQRKQSAFAEASMIANIQTAANTSQILDYTKDIAVDVADIKMSNRVIAANTDAIRRTNEVIAANTGRSADELKRIRERGYPSIWD